MKNKMTSTRKALKWARQWLRYFPMMTRMDYRNYMKSVAKCKEIVARMRQLQEEDKHGREKK